MSEQRECDDCKQSFDLKENFKSRREEKISGIKYYFDHRCHKCRKIFEKSQNEKARAKKIADQEKDTRLWNSFLCG